MVGPNLLLQALPRLDREFAALRRSLCEGLTDALIARLLDGGFDAAIVPLPFDISDLVCEPLFEGGFLLACARGHGLQRHALSAFEAGDIDEECFVAISPATLMAMVARRSPLRAPEFLTPAAALRQRAYRRE